eukprot:7381710-Prymnesium_polylepis.1
MTITSAVARATWYSFESQLNDRSSCKYCRVRSFVLSYSNSSQLNVLKMRAAVLGTMMNVVTSSGVRCMATCMAARITRRFRRSAHERDSRRIHTISRPKAPAKARMRKTAGHTVLISSCVR